MTLREAVALAVKVGVRLLDCSPDYSNQGRRPRSCDGVPVPSVAVRMVMLW